MTPQEARQLLKGTTPDTWDWNYNTETNEETLFFSESDYLERETHVPSWNVYVASKAPEMARTIIDVGNQITNMQRWLDKAMDTYWQEGEDEAAAALNMAAIHLNRIRRAMG